MESPSPHAQMESILNLFDEQLIDFCNTKARKVMTRSVWDNLPSVLRSDLETRSIEELRMYEWCFRKQGDETKKEPIVPFAQAGLDNIGRALQTLSIPRTQRERTPSYALCPAAKIGMTPKVFLFCFFVLRSFVVFFFFLVPSTESPRMRKFSSHY